MTDSDPKSSGAAEPLSAVLPLVGRTTELAGLEALMESADHSTAAVLLCGEGGVGKSRLAEELAGRAERRGWGVARGRAYPVETGVPYALFSDAFLPLLRELDDDTLTVLSRGGEAELHYLFPALASDAGDGSAEQLTDPEEFRTRLLWNFAEFLKSYAARTPLLVVLEDLQWADDSSLSLLHFLARQAVGVPVFLLCTYNESERERIPHIARIERSLTSLRAGEVHHLEPLTREHVSELICRTFSVDANLVVEFSALLFGWTRGNPFFVEEVLKSLVTTGRVHKLKGTWLGWDAKDFELPESIRDAVLDRVAGFSDNAQVVAELAAVIGTRAAYPLLASISGLEADDLLAALEELSAHGILSEQADGGSVVYDFPHPLVRQTLYAEFGLQRVRVLHGAVAEAMESFWGEAAGEHADELAYHFARTDSSQLSGKAVRYLAAAGKAALTRHANRESVDYLRAALDRWTEGDGVPGQGELLADLARAYTRLGEYETSLPMWKTVLGGLPEHSPARIGVLRTLGLVSFWAGGDHTQAMSYLQEGLDAAEAAENPAGVVQIRLVRGHCFQEMGRSTDALRDLDAALAVAEDLGDPRVLARVHRSLALLHVWTGPPDKAREHLKVATDLATQVDDLAVEFWARWGLAVLSGMRGEIPQMKDGVVASREVAERLRSPVLRLWTAEMSIEMAYAAGDWDRGITLGEQSIELARTLHQRTLLPRLLVWTSVFYVGRGDLDRAKALVDEAAEVAGLGKEDGPPDVHLVVPTYIGVAYYLLGTGDYQEAIQAAEKGLRIAEGTGYILWTVHRLLPILAEACLWAGEIDKAEEVGRLLRNHSDELDHKLGLAWADACDALVCWKRGNPERGAVLMRQAAEGLEAIPMIPEAARIRRQLAGRLAEIGLREESLKELRAVHDTFSQLGAELELEKTRMQFREVGQRPPPRKTGDGIAGLTGRELEIARLVAMRKSNKGIGKELGISPRTASTHLSNIFQKLEVSSRGELADLIRDMGLLDG